MAIQVCQLQCKEVLCLTTGQRLGFVSDVQIDISNGTVQAIIVPCPVRGLSVIHREDYIIPWSCIQKIGPDIILVDAKPDACRCPRGKPRQAR